MSRELKITARIEDQNPRHAYIGVFQNGGKAGVLCVDAEHATELLIMLNKLTRDEKEEGDAKET